MSVVPALAAMASSFRGAFDAIEDRHDAALQIDDGLRRLLPRLDARLVVRVDVDEDGVEAHGALVEGDEHAEGRGIESSMVRVRDSRPRIGEGLAGALEEPREVVARGDARLDLASRRAPGRGPAGPR